MAEISDISAWMVREQLERIEHDPLFAESERLRELLRHLVEQALAGNGGLLKEVTIGNAIYAREPAYDPRFDSTVRVEARRLRRKLAAYYAQKHPADRVRIELATGSYVPAFSRIAPEPREDVAQDGDGPRIFRPGSGAVLAIMPITALSHAADDMLFADGLTDELIFAMEQADGFRVASRSTVFRYKDRAYSVAEVARELGAHGILQGTVRRSGNLVRVTVELSDPDGFVSWSDRFDLPRENRFRNQELIATTVLSRFGFDASRMRAGAAGPRPGAIHVQASIYRARQLLDRQEPEALRQALDIFTGVTAKAQDYARGFTGIADCHCDLFRLGVLDRATALSGARAAVARALEVDPASVEAHTSLATLQAWLEWDRPAAEAAFKAALALGGNARCARLYGVFLTYAGRPAEAGRMFKRARRIEPLSNQQDCAEAVSAFQERRFAHLAAWAARDGELAPEVAFHCALALAFSDQPARALGLAEAIDHAGADCPLLAHGGAEIRAWAGQRQDAQDLLSGAVRNNGTHFARATLAMAAGCHDAAFAALELALQHRELGAVWISTDPRFDAVRQTQPFAGLLARLEALRPT